MITPGLDDGSFHSVTEKGLGLFGYKFGETYEVHAFDTLLTWSLLFKISLVLLVCFVVFRSLRRSFAHRPVQGATATIDMHIASTPLLLSPFTHKRKSSSQDLESNSELDDFLLKNSILLTPQNQLMPVLSASTNTTPSTPGSPENYHSESEMKNNILIKLIEEHDLDRVKFHKVH